MNKKKQEEGQKTLLRSATTIPVTRTPQREGGGGVKNVTKECSMMMSAIRPTPTRTAGGFDTGAKT